MLYEFTPRPPTEIEEHRLDSDYVDTFWTPVLGPTAICLLRHVDRHFKGGINLSSSNQALGQCLGVNAGTAHKAVDRLCRFGILRDRDDSEEGWWRVTISPMLPQVTFKMVNHTLPMGLAAWHRRCYGEGRGGATLTDTALRTQS